VDTRKILAGGPISTGLAQQESLWENSGSYLARRRSRPLLIGLTGLSSTGRNGFRFAALLDGRLRGDGFWIGSKDVFGFFCPASLAGARPS
jgi:hypothetical protein